MQGAEALCAGLRSNNSLTGSLPQEWSQLAQLVDLRAAANNLTGSLPASYSSLANLTAVRLWSNSLTGELQHVTFLAKEDAEGEGVAAW